MLQHGTVVLGPEHRPCFLSPPASKFWHCLGPSSLLVQRGTPHTPLVQRGTVSAADVFFPLSPPDFLLIRGAFLFFALGDFLVSRMAGAGHYRISGTQRNIRRGWPTAKRRRQLQARQRPSLPCAKFRAHGKHLCRVFVEVHGAKKQEDGVTGT